MKEKNDILLANNSPLMRDILKRIIQRTPGFSVAGEVTRDENLFSEARKASPYWMVISLPEGEDVSHKHKELLLEGTVQALFAISNDGKIVRITRMDIQEKDYESLTLPEMLNLIRSQGLPEDSSNGDDGSNPRRDRQ
jgi:DNA-binding NarL/FixJ family response regulator